MPDKPDARDGFADLRDAWEMCSPINEWECLDKLCHTRVGPLLAAYDATHAALARSQSRVEELEAVVKRLPVTADGVPVTPGMELWGIWDWHVTPYGPCDPAEDGCCTDSETQSLPANQAYSTEAAALAAKEGR